MTTKTIIITALPTGRGGLESSVLAVKRPTTSYSSIVSMPSTPVLFTSSANLNSNSSITLPLKQKIEPQFESYDEDDDDDYDDLMEPPRKRERLTHLSAEEKLFRRKMKNRIAAQTARDRKKAHMGDLEERIRRLETENATLKAENVQLKMKSGKLNEENGRLKIELDENDVSQIVNYEKTNADLVIQQTVEVLGSAEGTDDAELDSKLAVGCPNSDDILEFLQQLVGNGGNDLQNGSVIGCGDQKSDQKSSDHQRWQNGTFVETDGIIKHVEGDAEEKSNGLTFDHQYTIPDDQTTTLIDTNFISSHSSSDSVSFCPAAVTGQDVFISSSDNTPNVDINAPANENLVNFLQPENNSTVQPSPISPYGIVPGSPTNSDTLLSNANSDIPLLDDEFLKDALLNFEPNEFDNGSLTESLGSDLDLDDCLSVNIWEESFSNLFPNFSL